eukprot:11276719-Prorocentrum_lima.AAC.1
MVAYPLAKGKTKHRELHNVLLCGIKNEPAIWRTRPMAQSVCLFFGWRNQPFTPLLPDGRS